MVEVVTVERYKSLDGYTYDKRVDAERADAEWRKENEYDLERDIARLVAVGTQRMSYISRYFDFPKLFTLRTKHEDVNIVAKNIDSVPQVYFEFLKINREIGCYYTSAASAIADEIVRTENYLAAMAFVERRTDYQYEKVESQTIKIYGE